MRVSVVIPALNEASTIAQVVRWAAASNPFEIVVIDADSTDDTAANARVAGAKVVNWREVFPELEPHKGKGESLWRGVAYASGDIVVFLDADLASISSNIVAELAAPFVNEDVHMVRAQYQRLLADGTSGGGRVTELTAKPLIAQLFPELSNIQQPLGGEYALRRSSALEVPFVIDYGVEMGLLLDIAAKFGPQAIVETPTSPRQHRNRPLEELHPMAEMITRTALARASEYKQLRWRGEIPQRPALATYLD
ncbi:MAG: glucosyl-3-phosphoglycerate synthase [Corynebacterium sp.]|nr:glucosyl-3-phosphoglycerate synthase [Corynebacterium sp.]